MINQTNSATVEFIPDLISAKTISQELEVFFSQCEFSEILCDGQCTTCLQKDWCLLTPVSRYVK
jgi:hypothetical protein